MNILNFMVNFTISNRFSALRYVNLFHSHWLVSIGNVGGKDNFLHPDTFVQNKTEEKENYLIAP